MNSVLIIKKASLEGGLHQLELMSTKDQLRQKSTCIKKISSLQMVFRIKKLEKKYPEKLLFPSPGINDLLQYYFFNKCVNVISIFYP